MHPDSTGERRPYDNGEGERQSNRHANNTHRPRARFFMGQVGDERQDNRSDGASSLQHSSEQYPVYRRRACRDDASDHAITILRPMWSESRPNRIWSSPCVRPYAPRLGPMVTGVAPCKYLAQLVNHEQAEKSDSKHHG